VRDQPAGQLERELGSQDRPKLALTKWASDSVADIESLPGRTTAIVEDIDALDLPGAVSKQRTTAILMDRLRDSVPTNTLDW
jgi:hypothetical protein